MLTESLCIGTVLRAVDEIDSAEGLDDYIDTMQAQELPERDLALVTQLVDVKRRQINLETK